MGKLLEIFNSDPGTSEIETKVDSLQADITTIDSNLDSVKEEVEEIEKHLHNNEKWFGVAASPSGETHVADRMGGTTQPFELTSGDSDFGSWVQILGSSDTPVQSGKIRFDMHRILVTTTDSTEPFNIQFVTGESADIADKIAAEDFTEKPYKAASNLNDSGIDDTMFKDIEKNTKVWARCCCVGQNGKKINFYPGIHEY